MHTTAVWWRVAPETLAQAFPNRAAGAGRFFGAAYAMHHGCVADDGWSNCGISAARWATVGSGWFARVETNGRGVMHKQRGEPLSPDAQQRFQPTLFLYDDYPGGVGLSQPLFGRASAAGQRRSRADLRMRLPLRLSGLYRTDSASDERRGHSAKRGSAKRPGIAECRQRRLAALNRQLPESPSERPDWHSVSSVQGHSRIVLREILTAMSDACAGHFRGGDR